MKLGPKEIKVVNEYFVRPVKNRLKEIFMNKGLPQLKTADDIPQPPKKQQVEEIELFNEFNKRNPKADGGRAEFKEGTPKKSNQFLFDYSVIDDIKKDAKTMAKKEILEKYKGKISRAALTRLGLTYGKTLDSGRPRVSEGERTIKNVKRANRIRNAQGFDVSGTASKNFHHIFPIGGLAEISPKDVMILDKNINEKLGGSNLRLNDIADEIGSMNLSSPNALKKLNDLNAESKKIVDNAKSKLPKKLKNIIGYIEYSPVFDENGTIIELSQIRKGVDKNPSELAKFGDKKFKNFTANEKKDFKKQVLNVAKKAESKGMMLAANPMFNPGILKEAFKQLPTPAGAVGLNLLLGVDPTSAVDRASIAAEAAFAPQLVKQAAKLGTVGQKIANLGLTPAMAARAARIASPLGIASLAAEGLYQGGKFTKKRIEELRSMTPEQREELRRQGEAQAFDPFQAAGGGIAKQAGDRSGPMLKSMNPDKDGLLSLMKRGKKI